ncbi:MaoC family dehydratase [Chryseomicrobium sp. FSL W7-1435]|uniref:MaoC family dehydratase n=1 Tax=Chryseomicrobium sp. FSL W7-1435 TaxID=2921704 RepID=UPI003159C02F
MYIGQTAFLERTFEESDIINFANLTLDTNPVHLDEGFAKHTRFKKRIAHGLLTGSLIGAVLGTKLPGSGAVLLKQSFNFKEPVFVGDRVKAVLEVTEINEKSIGKIVKIKSRCFNQFEIIVLDGESTLLISAIK